MPAVFGQLAQKRPLGRCQGKGGSVRQGHKGIVQVHAPVAQLQDCCFCPGKLGPVSTLQKVLHPQKQFLHQKWLGQVIVCAQSQPEQAVGIGVPCREEQGRHIGFCPQGTKQRKPVSVREVDVQDHQFRHLGCKGGLCGGTVLHGADVPKSIAVLNRQGIRAVTQAQHPDVLELPALPDEALAALVSTLAENGVGVVGLTTQTKNLEEIFLSLTQTSGEVA